MSYTRCPIFVGRIRELDALQSALANVRVGKGSATAILGSAGMGKTRLLRELSRQAVERGTQILQGRATQAGTSTAFRPLTEALLAGLRGDPTAVDTDPGLAPFRPALGRLVPLWRDGNAPDSEAPLDESPVILAEGVLRLLGKLAGESGLVLALDDLHWADPETLAIVEYLADNVAAQPVLLVWTARGEPGPAAALAHALAPRGSGLLTLGRMSDDDVAQMSAACLNHQPPAEMLATLHRRAAGTPLLVEELLATGGTDAATLVPVTVQELVARRTATLSGVALDCVRHAAVLGEVFDWTLLPQLIHTEPEKVTLALRETSDAQLIASTPAGLAFPHTLIRDAVLAAMLPPERTAAAARALTIVRAQHSQLDAPWDEVAANLALLSGDSIVATQILLSAGRRDLRRGALATAEATLGRAAELAASDDRLVAEVDDSLAEVLARAGKTDAAVATSARLISRLDEQVDGARLATAHLRMARVHGASGAWPAAEAAIGQAQRWATHAGDDSLSARVQAAAAHAALGRSRFTEAQQYASAALEVAESVGDLETACDTLEVFGRIARLQNVAKAEELFERAHTLAESGGLAVHAAQALHELSTVDARSSLRYDGLETARQRALDAGALGTVAVVDLHLAATAIMRWDLDRMHVLAWRGVTSARQLRLATLPKALVLAGVTDIICGQSDGEPQFSEALRLAPDTAHLHGDVWGARALRSLLANDHARAITQLGQLSQFDPGEVIASPQWGMWALMSAASTGEIPALPDGIALYRWNRAHLRFAQAIVLGKRGHSADAAAAFAEADAEMREPVDVRWHRRHARRIVAESALANQWGDPVKWVTDDLPFFETLGHDRIASACRGLLRRAGVAVPRRGQLAATFPEELRCIGVTAREHEVLQLVGEGLDNRGVAQRLVLSPRTVEKHIQRLLAKTGLTRRTELVALAARHTTPAANIDVRGSSPR
jgi:DNA-binding CsgD family transcriptional regulator/tetratricopeptide (TPR) repeat protein